MKRLPNVEFSKTGWNQFAAVNRCLGSRFIKGFILRNELAEYIGAHYESGNRLDPYCQELRYDDGVYLILQQIGNMVCDRYLDDLGNRRIPAGVYLEAREARLAGVRRPCNGRLAEHYRVCHGRGV